MSQACRCGSLAIGSHAGLPRKRLLVVAAIRTQADADLAGGEVGRQHQVAFELLKVAKRKRLCRGILVLHQRGPFQRLQTPALGAIQLQAQFTLADFAAVEILGEGDSVVPCAVGLAGDLHAVHIEAFAPLAIAHQPLIKRHVGAQLGNFFFAFGEGLLQALVGSSADLVGALQRTGALAQRLDLRLRLPHQLLQTLRLALRQRQFSGRMTGRNEPDRRQRA